MLLVAASLLSVQQGASGQTLWTAGVDDWFTPGNWTLGVPIDPLDAVIENGGTAQILGPGGSVHRLRVGRAAGGGNLLVDGGTLVVTDDLHLNEGSAGPASMIVQNGSTVTAPDTVVGFNSSFATSFLISGEGTVYNASNDFNVGRLGSGAASLTIDGGAVLASGTSSIAPFSGAAGSNATVSGAGSRWSSSGAFTVGSGVEGTLNVAELGTVHVGTNLAIASTSNVNLNGGTLRFNTVSGLNRLNFIAGAIQLAGNRTIGTDATVTTLFGSASPITIPIGKGLVVEGDTRVDAQLDVNGGTLESGQNFTDNLLIGYQSVGVGKLQITNGGSVKTRESFIGGGELLNPIGQGDVVVRGAGSAWTSDSIVVGSQIPSGAQGYTSLSTLAIEDDGLVDTGVLLIQPQGIVAINGGTLRLSSTNVVAFHRFQLDGYPDGQFNFYAGTIQLAGDRVIGSDPSITGLIGAAPILTSEKGFAIEGTATLATTLTVDGGTFSVGQLANGHNLRFLRGTLNITNDPVTIAPGGPLGDALDVDDDMTVNVTLGLTNQGLVTGDGEVGGTFTNAAGGELRAQPGRSLALTGAGNANDGQIKLLGGELDFQGDLTNNAGAFISGNGSLLTAGLTNNGTMNFAGTANIVGDVVNSAGGKIISGGGGATIFFDDVTNDGEIRTSANGFTVFFGAVDGAGAFTGTGTVNFEGDLSPGNSPAVVQFAGDVVLGPDATLRIELGGVLPGQYDQVQVAGELTLGGALELSLIDGFTPSVGQTFDFLNWGSVAGAFSSVELPSLVGFQWDVSQLSAGVLSVAPAYTADFDEDGDVDSDDLAQWEGDFGFTGDSDADADGDSDGDDFLAWQRQLGSPTIVAATAAVPEPTTLLLLVVGVPAMLFRRRVAGPS